MNVLKPGVVAGKPAEEVGGAASELFLREALRTHHTESRWRPEKKPRGSRVPVETAAQLVGESHWARPSWRLNAMLQMLGQANDRLMLPWRSVRVAWNAPFMQGSTQLSQGDEKNEVCYLAANLSFCSNPYFVPSLSPLMTVVDPLSSQSTSLPTGLELETRLESLNERDTFLSVDVSTLAWAYPWGMASYFHRFADRSFGLGVYASAPLTDSFKGLTEVERTILTEEAIVGARYASRDYDAGVQMEVLDQLLASWFVARRGPWLGGFQARFPVDHLGMEMFEAKLFYNEFVDEAFGSSRKRLSPSHLNSRQRVTTETGLQILDMGRLYKASYFRHFKSPSLGGWGFFKTGIDVGVELGLTPFASSNRQRSTLQSFNVAAYWQQTPDLDVSIYSGSEQCGLSISPVVSLGDAYLKIRAAFTYSFKNHVPSIQFELSV